MGEFLKEVEKKIGIHDIYLGATDEQIYKMGEMKLYNPCIEMCKMLWYGPDEEGDFYSMGTYRYIRSVRNRNI